MRTRLYFIFLLLCLPFVASAQNVYCNEYLPPDPQSWGFIKYGGQRPNLYSGTIHEEIPIYTYKDPDFEIPIALSYSSNGYMPNITTNYVGLGWTLNVGGVISRRVRGAKDEGETSNVSYNGGTTSVQGLYRYVSSNYAGEQDTLLTGLGMCIGVAGQIFETESDIYMFSFMGHTGKFVISEQGGVQVYDTNHPSGEYRVSLSQFKATRYKSVISIRTGDGYEYEFGNYGGVSNLTHLSVEYEKWGSTNSSGTPSQDDYSDDWFLTKITAPNGRTASFSYKIDSETMFESMHPGGKYESFETYTSTGGSLASIYTASTVYNDSFRLLERKYAVLPSSITIGGCTISFVYGEREAEKGWKVVTHTSDLLTPVKLEEIHVTHSQVSGNLCDCTLTYKYPNVSGNRVLLLSNVTVAGSGEYSMNYYYENGVFPFQGETCVDHWGYYNNNSGIDPLNMIPDAGNSTNSYLIVSQ